jgi:hypothetical protein
MARACAVIERGRDAAVPDVSTPITESEKPRRDASASERADAAVICAPCEPLDVDSGGAVEAQSSDETVRRHAPRATVRRLCARRVR